MVNIMNNKDIIDTILDNSISTGERGDAFEKLAISIIEDKMGSCSCSKTKSSGRIHGDGDIVINEMGLTADCKLRSNSKSSINAKMSEIRKIQFQASKMGRIGTILASYVDPDVRKVEVYSIIRLSDLLDIILEKEKRNERK